LIIKYSSICEGNPVKSWSGTATVYGCCILKEQPLAEMPGRQRIKSHEPGNLQADVSYSSSA